MSLPHGDVREGLVGPCDAGCHTGRISATYRHVTVMREFTRGKPPIARFACPLPQNVLSRERGFVVVSPQGIPGDSDPFSVVSM